MLALSCYILADTFFIAKALGSNGLTALNLSISIYSFMLALGLMLGIGGASRYSILLSQGKAREADHVFSSMVKFGLLVSVFISGIGIFGAEALAKTLGANEDTLAMTRRYLSTILFSAPFFTLNSIFIAFIRNDKNPSLSMFAMLAGSFSNIILDYIFMFPLKMGIFGAALATSLSPIISLSILFKHFYSGKKSLSFLKYKLSFHWVKNASSLGLSAFITEISSGLVLLTFNYTMLSLAGNIGVAAYSIVANIALVAISFFTGIGQGIQPLVSRYYGLNKEKEMKEIGKYAFTTALIFSLLIYSFSFAFTHQIVEGFNSDGLTAIQNMAINGIHIYFLGFFFAGINICISMYLSASEKARQAFLLSISRGLIVIVPSILIFGNCFGTRGVWFSFVFTEAIVCLIAFLVIKRIK